MIISGKSRGDAVQLGRYLLAHRENDFVYVHRVEGFASDDVMEAMYEAELIAAGTRAQKHLYSLSLNPPPGAHVTDEQFDEAIRDVGEALGLADQPRVAVIHEKGERDRHMHVVFSRIDSEEMKAIPVPFNRLKLKDVSRSLFIKHGWNLPDGYIDRSKRNPLRYTLEEYRHAKRVGVHPQDVKAALQEAWAISDSPDALQQALNERGYKLARGDRRGFLAVDHKGEPYSLPKWLGLKTKAVRDRLGDERRLQSLSEARADLGRDMQARMDEHKAALRLQNEERKTASRQGREEMLERQRIERDAAWSRIEARQIEEAQMRQSRFRSGLGFVWDMMRGENRRIRQENEQEAKVALERDRQERHALIVRQRQQRDWLITRQRKQALSLRAAYRDVVEDRRHYAQMQQQDREQEREAFKRKRRATSERKPRRASHDRGPEP